MKTETETETERDGDGDERTETVTEETEVTMEVRMHTWCLSKRMHYVVSLSPLPPTWCLSIVCHLHPNNSIESHLATSSRA